jgi:putative transposase
VTNTKRACHLLGKSRATHYRRVSPKPVRQRAPRPAPANKLSVAERASVLTTLNHESFVDKSVAQVWATLLDQGAYLFSESTMYRILGEAGGARERRRQATHPAGDRGQKAAVARGSCLPPRRRGRGRSRKRCRRRRTAGRGR